MKLIGKQQGEFMEDDAVIGAELVEESIGDFIGEQFDAAEATETESVPVAQEIRDRAEESDRISGRYSAPVDVGERS